MSDTPYIVTARKYRPQLFADLVGQQHVADTLRNAITLERLAHAYLFSGPRGIGKTSCARILAKAINCSQPLSTRDRGEPCRECESCRTFEEGRSMNIFEIDAASNNSVDDVRSLRDKVSIKPQGAEKKVYIIDEVHMLSNSAFNALLKTLEEPPPFVLFIFATTEPHKVLATILSRCQRFDFRRITIPDAVAHLRSVCEAENISADEESLTLLARKGDGAMRDSLSVLDQSVALCGPELVHDQLARALGVIATDRFYTVTDLIAEKRPADVFGLVADLTVEGTDYIEFLNGLSEHFRNLLVARSLGSADLIEASHAQQARYLKESERFTDEDLLHLLNLASKGEQDLKFSAQPRLQLELILLQMVKMPGTLAFADLLKKIEYLQANPPTTGQPFAVSQKSPESRTPPAEQNPEKRTEIPKQTEPESPSLTLAHENVAKPGMGGSDDAEPDTPQDIPASSGLAVGPAKSVETSRKQGSAGSDVGEQIRKSLFGPPAIPKNTDSPTRPENAVGQMAPGSDVATLTEIPIPDAGLVSTLSQHDQDRVFFEVKSNWTAFCEHVKTARIDVNALLHNSQPARAADGTIQIAVPYDFHAERLESQTEFLQSELRSYLHLDENPKLGFYVQPNASPDNAAEKNGKSDHFATFEELSQNHPVVRALVDQFGAELVW